MTKTIATHSGMFHPDDVFAVATLLLVYPEAHIVRTRDVNVIQSANIAVDVGLEYDPERQRFDHHQSGGAGIRPNGIPYASFGLVWKEYGEWLAGVEGKDLIEQKLVMPIDAPDNRVSVYNSVFEAIEPFTIRDFFYSFIDDYTGGEDYLYKIFIKSVKAAKELLEREIKKAHERVGGMREVRKILENASNKSIIVLDKALPWEPILTPISEVFFVVYPRREGNWGAKAIPATVYGMERKKYFPESWAGKEHDELVRVSGVSDAIFCTLQRYLAVARTRNGAVKLAENALHA